MPNIGETKRVGDVVGRWDGQTWRRVPTQSQADADANVGTVLGPNYHPGANESPASAAFNEIARTGTEAAKGLAHSPLDLLASILHPIDTIKGMVGAVKDPSAALAALVSDPKAAGSALGTTLLAEKLPGLAADAASAAPAALSRAAGAVGKGLEAAGNSTAAKLTGRYGPGAVLMHPTPVGAATSAAAVAAPPALRGLGRVLQKFGPVEEAAPAAVSALSDVEKAGLVKQGFSPDMIAKIEAQAAKTSPTKQLADLSVKKGAPTDAGTPGVKSTEIPYRMGDEVPSGVEGLNAPIDFAEFEPVEPGTAARKMATDQLMEAGPGEEVPGNIRYNDASTNSPASLKALNDLVEKTPDISPVTAKELANAPFSHENFLQQLRRAAASTEDLGEPPAAAPPADVLPSSNPIERLANLSRIRERGRAFRTGTPLAEAY